MTWIQVENFPTSHLDSSDKLPLLEIPVIVTSSRAEDTFALGRRLALLLKAGSIVALRGPLGAGKTCLAKGIASGLGVKDEVISPTYTIVSEYEGAPENGKAITVFHIDAYRLSGNDDFTAIGGEEIIYGKGISIVEWYERIADFIPEEALKVDIEIKDGNNRSIAVYRGEKTYAFKKFVTKPESA